MSRPWPNAPSVPHGAPTWEVTPAERTPHLGQMLRLGTRAIPVSQIRGFIGSADPEADKKPAFAIMIVFGIAAIFFILGVMDIGWRPRFLLAAALFGGIALSAFHDIAWLTTSAIFRIEVLTANGETLRHATINPVQHQALLAALERLVATPRPANPATTSYANSSAPALGHSQSAVANA
jgi:hypothetical protein